MPARPLGQPSSFRAGRKNSRTQHPQPRAPWNWLCQATSAAPLGGSAVRRIGGGTARAPWNRLRRATSAAPLGG